LISESTAKEVDILSENTDINKDIESDELPEEVVNYVLAFADALNGSFGYTGAITPILLNQMMKDVSLNPLQATEAQLSAALKSPKDSELVLQAFSQDFEIQSQPYRRLLSYLGNMLSFDLTMECINVKKPDEYKSAKYKKDEDLVKSFFDRFDYKKEFATVVAQLLRNEAFFSCPRFDGDQIVLQELPSSPTYTMITGRWDYGLLFSMNMYWFLQSGVDIDMYPDFFIEKKAELWEQGAKENYISSMSPELRGISSWAYWQDIPVTVGWCWKMNPAIATRVPYFSGLFLDLIQQPLMRALQKDVNMSTAARLILGEIPMLKEAATKVKDQFSISAKNLGNFLAIVKAAIGDSLKTAALPLNDVKGITFPHEEKLYSSYLKTALATSGINTNLIFTNELKMNTIETQLALNVDEQLMMALYSQFEGFLKYHINQLTKFYKFDFHFEGTQFFNNRQQRLDAQIALLAQGIVMPQKIAAALNMSPISMQRQMEEAKAKGWVDDLTPIVPAFQQGADTGRPKTSDSRISDEGEQARADGGNIGKE